MERRTIVQTLVTVVVLCTGVLAQPPGWRGWAGPFRDRGSALTLLSLAAVLEVQKELQITSRQRDLLDSLREDLRDQRRSLFRRARNEEPDDASPTRLQEQIRHGMERLDNQGEQLIGLILDPPQRERLDQIRLQWEGVRAFDRPEFVKALEVSDEQLEQIRTILAASRTRRFGVTEVSQDQQSDTASPTVDDQIAAVLTDVQKERWQAMKGTDFPFRESLSRALRTPRRGRDNGP